MLYPDAPGRNSAAPRRTCHSERPPSPIGHPPLCPVVTHGLLPPGSAATPWAPLGGRRVSWPGSSVQTLLAAGEAAAAGTQTAVQFLSFLGLKFGIKGVLKELELRAAHLLPSPGLRSRQASALTQRCTLRSCGPRWPVRWRWGRHPTTPRPLKSPLLQETFGSTGASFICQHLHLFLPTCSQAAYWVWAGGCSGIKSLTSSSHFCNFPGPNSERCSAAI